MNYYKRKLFKVIYDIVYRPETDHENLTILEFIAFRNMTGLKRWNVK